MRETAPISHEGFVPSLDQLRRNRLNEVSQSVISDQFADLIRQVGGRIEGKVLLSDLHVLSARSHTHLPKEELADLLNRAHPPEEWKRLVEGLTPQQKSVLIVMIGKATRSGYNTVDSIRETPYSGIIFPGSESNHRRISQITSAFLKRIFEPIEAKSQTAIS